VADATGTCESGLEVMIRKRVNRHSKPPLVIEVMVEHVPAPDAAGRLARAYDIILRAAARVEGDKANAEATPKDRDGGDSCAPTESS